MDDRRVAALESLIAVHQADFEAMNLCYPCYAFRLALLGLALCVVGAGWLHG